MTDELTNQPSEWNPPDGGLSLDELFPNPENASQTPTPVAQNVTPQAHQPEYFLKASTGTVYNSLEDAVRGTEEKDRTVERLKAELAQLKAQTPQPQSQPQADFAETAFDKLATAAQKGDKRAYIQALAEVQMATLQQFAPVLSGVYEQNAVSRIESEGAENFRAWLNSPDYTRTLEQFPRLAEGIQAAKNDPRFAGNLEEFYRLAYGAYVASKAKEISTTAARNSAPAPTQPRPTLQANYPTPVTQSGGPRVSSGPMTREQVLSNRQARQEFIKRYQETRGAALDSSFGELGL